MARIPLIFSARRIAARADGVLLAMSYNGGVMASDPDGPEAQIWLAAGDERGADLNSSPDRRFAVTTGEGTGQIRRFEPDR